MSSATAYPKSAALTQFLKAGLQGTAGTGKSTTAAFLGIGLSKHLHGGAPVFAFDTEPGWAFLEPIFRAENVPLIIENGRHFQGMQESLKRAIEEGCCAFVVDSITHPWQELLERFADSTGRVPFHKFNQIKPMWGEWTTDFLNAPLHAIACGRLTFDYFYEEAEDGKKELIKGDTKMKAGGGESFGYEPHLLIEMGHQRKRLKQGKLGGMQYTGFVLKDRSRALNGKEFLFDDIGQYKPDGYKKVWDAFRPHLETLADIVASRLPKSTSAAIIPNGDSTWAEKQREKTSLLEDWYATMDLLIPGRTDKEKQLRLRVTEAITGVRSKTRFEGFSMDQLQQCCAWLKCLEDRCKTENHILASTTEGDALALVEMAKEDFRSGRRQDTTVLEKQLQESLAAAKAKKSLEVTDADCQAVRKAEEIPF